MKAIKPLALGAGADFITLAVFVQGFLPAFTPESRGKKVTRAVRNDLGVPVRRTGEGYALGPQPELARSFTLEAEPRVPLFPNQQGLAFADPKGRDGKIPGTPVLDLRHFKGAPPGLAAVTVVVPSADMVGLVAYLQKLGTSRGAWRDVFEPHNLAVSVMEVPRTLRLVQRGREFTSSAARAATASGGTATARPPPSSTRARGTSRSRRSSSEPPPRGRCRRTATCSGPSPAASGGRRCRPGTSCPRRTAWR